MKKRLRKHGPYGEYLATAREVLRFHESEAKQIRKHIAKAAEIIKEDCLDGDSEEEGFPELVWKRQKGDDQEMKMD